LEDVGHGFDNELLFSRGNMILSAGTRLAVIGENGAGKTTFLRCLLNELAVNNGTIKWAESASLGHCPQDSSIDFDCELNLFDWMSQWRKPSHNDQIVRATLGQLLFSGDDYEKPVKVCSGGEKNRLLFGKLMMMDTNVLILDEPTNHLDMEAIEALNLALIHYEGTLIFVSHDREFVSSLATRVIEIKDQQMVDFQGTYDEYLTNQADTGNVAGFR
jgi:ATPase subunit of ABC transporter with duplicated ATPase domains